MTIGKAQIGELRELTLSEIENVSGGSRVKLSAPPIGTVIDGDVYMGHECGCGCGGIEFQNQSTGENTCLM